MSTPKLVVLSDFDGTITTVDTAVYILEHFSVGDWKGLEREVARGRISVEECIRCQLEMICIGQERIIEELDKVIRPRPNLDVLLERCRSRGDRFEVTSAGLDFYIRHFLRRHGWQEIEVIAPRCRETTRGLEITLPACECPEANNFKEDRVRHYQSAGCTVVYIGDGVADAPAARRADIAFAIKGTKLSRLLAASGTPFREFEDFAEVVGHLDGR